MGPRARLPHAPDVPVDGARWHTLLELAGYTVGFQLFLALRRRHPHPTRGRVEGFWVLVGAVIGALVGAKLLDLAQFWSFEAPRLATPAAWLGGKTIVGGLLGGWVGVEAAKWFAGLRGSTGDLMVLPLGVGIALGRFGCLLAGPDDHTFGVPVSWGWDGGDGVPRHPTPLYEAVFVFAWAALLSRRRFPEGNRFRWFMVGYLGFRFFVEFLKPPFGPDPLDPTPDRWLGLTAIQWASVAGAGYALHLIRRVRGADGAA